MSNDKTYSITFCGNYTVRAANEEEAVVKACEDAQGVFESLDVDEVQELPDK